METAGDKKSYSEVVQAKAGEVKEQVKSVGVQQPVKNDIPGLTDPDKELFKLCIKCNKNNVKNGCKNRSCRLVITC